MTLVFIKFNFIFKHPDFAVHSDSDIAVLEQLCEGILEGSFFISDDRCHDSQSCSVFKRHHRIGHLLDGLAGDRDVVVWTVGSSCSCIKQTQVVIDFRDGADR